MSRFVLCACETWSLTLRKAYRLSAEEKIWTWTEVLTRGWKTLQNEECQHLNYFIISYIRAIQSRMMRLMEGVAIKMMRNAFRILGF
jgi:hypothetical protein